MQIRLLDLELTNFMGVSAFIFSPQGLNTIVRADNSYGKTTLFSALMWLLFDHDAAGRADFEIKTKDANGAAYTGLDHIVAGTLEIDGKPTVLKKAYKEKWQKKRGQQQKTFVGHAVDHFIDGVPVKKNEWKSRLGEIIQEETFRLLTNPFYFPSLHWEKKRNLLLSLCSEVTDQEVVQQDSALSALPEILGDRSLTDHRKAVKARQTEINKRLTEIPARIDELNESIKEADKHSKHLLNERIAELNGKLMQMQKGGLDPELVQERQDLERELREIRDKWDQEKREKIKGLQDSQDALVMERRKLSSELRNVEERLKEIETLLRNNHSKRQSLRQEFYQVKEQDPGNDIQGVCPTCGQSIPQEQFEDALKKARESQAERKKQIQQEGTRLKNEAETLDSEQEKLRARSDELDSGIATLDQQTEEKEKELQEARREEPGPSQRETEITQRLEEIGLIEQSSEAPDTSEIETELEEKRTALAQVEAAQSTKKRIKKLKEEEESLGAEWEKLQQEVYLMERFTVAQAHLMEERVNSMFDMARFRLFEEQVDGGINPTCDILYNGVSFNHGLNRGAQTNVGLDIIKTLSAYYGVWAPVFIDNAEAVSWLLDPGTQTIKLVVAPGVHELRVETEKTAEEVA